MHNTVNPVYAVAIKILKYNIEIFVKIVSVRYAKKIKSNMVRCIVETVFANTAIKK